jgi:hypothetical protein
MLDPTSLLRHYPILPFVVGLVDLHPVLEVVADCSYHRGRIVVGHQEVPILAEHIADNADLVGVGNPVQDILQVVVAVGGAVVLLFGVEACRSQDEAGIGVDHQTTGIVEEDTVEEEVVDGFASQAAVEEEIVVAGEEVVVAGEEVAAVEEAAAGSIEVAE